MASDAVINSDQVTAINDLMRSWDSGHARAGWDPTEMLAEAATIVEAETESYLKADPDPFDERHPTRVNPLCTLGQLFRIICKKDTFMDALVIEYTRDNYWQRNGATARDCTELNTHAVRLLFDIMPGLETSVVFQDAEALIRRLYVWADTAPEPLRSYATALLASAMEIQDIAANFRDNNARLVPAVMQRLQQLQNEHLGTPREDILIEPSPGSIERPFASVGAEGSSPANSHVPEHVPSVTVRPCPNFASENSNSSWAELAQQLIGTFQVYPITPITQQIMLLRFLTPLGEYQEWLGHVIENRMLDVIVQYIDFRRNNHARLAFEALRYLSALLCHKRFTLDFLNRSGVELLLSVPRPGVAATGVSMCLYYLAYNEDAMERICQLSDSLISRLVRYTLWLLECSHESGRCHATMCFGLSFQFRSVLAHFDRQDGMRKLLNVVSTQRILTSGRSDVFDETDDQFPARQIMRHVCCAIKCYLEVHLILKAYQVKRTADGPGGRHVSSAAPLCVAISAESVQESLEMFASMSACRTRWKPVNSFLKLGGLRALLQIIDVSQDVHFSGRSDIICSALDAINICCVLPVSQLQLCERQSFPGDRSVVGIALIIAMADTEMGDAEVQKSALRVIISCVSRVMDSPSNAAAVAAVFPDTPSAGAGGKRWLENVLPLMWDAVRKNNGIMVLMSLVQTKTPITDADAIRALACRALVGLARSDSAKQIMSKLPLFTCGQLQMAVREPILQEKRCEHVQLQRDALTLLERVSGRDRRPLHTADSDLTLETIHRANIVAQTRIHYNEQQLLQLMHTHLLTKGLTQTAAVLRSEAGFLPITPAVCGGTVRSRAPLLPSLSSHSPVSITQNAGTPGSVGSLIRRSAGCAVSNGPSQQDANSNINNVSFCTPGSSIRALVRGGVRHADITLSPASARNNRLRLGDQQSCSPLMNGNTSSSQCSTGSNTGADTVSLDRIVTEYLMNQHALCRHPMVTCPQFDLLVPHRCPEPCSRRLASLNLVARVSNRTVFPPYGGTSGHRQNTRLLYSRYCPVRTLRDLSDDGGGTLFTSATFSSTARHRSVLVGSHDGTVRVFNADTGEVENTYESLHSSSISNLKLSEDGRLLLTSSRRRRPLSALWSVNGSLNNRHNFTDDEYIEFCNSSGCDRALGTERHASGALNFNANVYDLQTGQRVVQLSPRIGNSYSANRAVFSADDELVLNDGVLFDLRREQEVHKFDKFNNTINGVFHPTRPEIVANTEVWDMRTFHLLHTVPALNQCRLQFGNHEPVVFGVKLGSGGASGLSPSEDESDEVSAFRVVHAGDYSSIATIDVRRHVYGLCLSGDDLQLAVVESQLDSADIELDQACVRIYDVGRVRGADDVDDDEEDAGPDDDEDNGDDSDQSDAPDNLARDIADALFGYRRRRRNSGLEEDDDDSDDSGDDDSDSTFSLSVSDFGDNVADDAENSDNSWVTEDED